MELSVTAAGTSKNASTCTISDVIASEAYHEPLIHQVVTSFLAGARAGTKAQKTRAEVRGGGKKPWRQKGTGRARVGSIRSPLWRGGGIIHAAVPRDFRQKLNKKMYRKAMRSIWAELIRSGRLQVVEKFSLAEAKTKLLLAQLKEMNVGKALLLTDEFDEKLFLAARNLRDVQVRHIEDVDPVVLIAYDKVIITVQALKQVEEVLGK